MNKGNRCVADSDDIRRDYPRTTTTVLWAVTAHLVVGAFLVALFMFLIACLWLVTP